MKCLVDWTDFFLLFFWMLYIICCEHVTADYENVLFEISTPSMNTLIKVRTSIGTKDIWLLSRKCVLNVFITFDIPSRMGETTTLMDLRNAFASIDDLWMISSIVSLNTTVTLLLINCFSKNDARSTKLYAKCVTWFSLIKTYTFLLNPLLWMT